MKMKIDKAEIYSILDILRSGVLDDKRYLNLSEKLPIGKGVDFRLIIWLVLFRYKFQISADIDQFWSLAFK